MPVAIVTGGARGIGAATAAALRSDGCDLVVFDRCADDPALTYQLATSEQLAATADAVGGLAIEGDVRNVDDLQQAVDAAIANFGGVDIVVAAAGVMVAGEPVWEIDDAQWDVLLAVNLTGVLNLARAAVPAMLKRPNPRVGRFVAVSSAAALKATPSMAAYAASKAGVIGLVRSLAADLANTGITANTVQPGSTNTHILDPSAAAYGLDSREQFAEHHIDNRLLDPTEVGATIAWLCSPAASAVNGAVIPADAGMTSR